MSGTTLKSDRSAGFGFESMVEAVKARRKMILVGTMFIATAMLVQHVMRPSYRAATTLMVSRAQNSPLQALMGKMTGTNFTSGRTNEYQDKYLLFLASQDFRIAAARMLIKDPAFAGDRQKWLKKSAFSQFTQSILYSKIDHVGRSDVELETVARALRMGLFMKKGFDNIEVTVNSSNPEQAVRLVNFLATAAVQIISEREIGDLVEARDYVDQQLKIAETRLGEIDTAIVDFRKKNKYFTTDSVPDQFVDRIRNLRSAIEAATLKRDLNNRLIELLTKELESEKETALSPSGQLARGSDVINQLHVRLQGLRYKRVLLQAQGEPADSAQSKSVDDTIATVTNQLKTAMHELGGSEADASSLLSDKDGLVTKIHGLRRENQYVESQLETYRKAVNEALTPLESLPAAVQTMVGYNRGTQMEYGMLQEMKRKVLEIEIEKISLKSKIRILEKATLAGIPLRWGPLPKFVMGLMVGLFLTVLVAYALESVDTTVKSPLDFKELGVPLVGQVPMLWSGFADRWLPLPSRHRPPLDLVAEWRKGADGPLGLSMNHVAARLEKMPTAEGRRGRVVLVTSARQGEGKSFVSTNLALALAHAGRRVLLVDTDFRRPMLAKMMQLSAKGDGLADELLTGRGFTGATLVRNVLEGLDVMLTGHLRGSSTELLGSAAFAKWVNEAAAQYDAIVLDAAPVLPVVDSLLVAPSADCVLLAVSNRRTTWKDFSGAIDKVRSMANTVVLGVFNRVDDAHEYVYISPSRRLADRKAHAAPTTAKLDVKGELARFRDSEKGNRPS